jgi:hypothetical protein
LASLPGGSAGYTTLTNSISPDLATELLTYAADAIDSGDKHRQLPQQELATTQPIMSILQPHIRV